MPRCDKRGSPGQNTLPAQAGSYIEEALASRAANHQALVAQPACCILAINELDDTQLPPQELLASYKGHVHAECGFRFRKGPRFLAALLYLKTPERILALQIAMMACLPVSAALMYRLRKAIKGSGGTFERFYC
jgi:transposase